MFKHSKIGTIGEEYAAEYLLKKGYTIITRNWRYGKKEIDIIAADGKTLVFAEVKTRSGLGFGRPEEAVGIKKQQVIKSLAECYLNENPGYLFVRFDVLSIVYERDMVCDIVHLIDAF